MQINFSKKDRELLKREILVSIGIESLKKEILNDTNSQEAKIAALSKNPAVLLILGFILTTGIGTFFTWIYQSGEWSRQQKYLNQQRNFDEKKDLVDETTKAIAEMIAAADDALSIFYWNDNNKIVSKEDINRKEKWEQNSLNWRTSMYTLPPKLKTYFRNSEIETKFGEIVEQRKFAGNNIKNLYTDYVINKTKALKNPENQEYIEDSLNKINEMRQQLGELTGLMIKEINEDSNQNISY
ncbi:MAG TPA: hypothetical protein VF596_16205 [Pyrinomonadaceae bacterium]|jgi:hypothetical protein